MSRAGAVGDDYKLLSRVYLWLAGRAIVTRDAAGFLYPPVRVTILIAWGVHGILKAGSNSSGQWSTFTAINSSAVLAARSLPSWLTAQIT